MDRTMRISEEIKREISGIIQTELKDPRLSKLISVTHVKATKDLRYAKVFVSIMADDEEKKEVLKGLESAAGFIRREIGSRLQIRYSPEIIFEIDNSIEYGAQISKLIKDIKEKDK
ncbi:MAG TPA: 30S ribosome-binding factor RbfA [Clostridium sp.]|jgi:ribosome-binding factor A|nr:30S ribosome-binding factor RbfA [Clostridium sp.]